MTPLDSKDFSGSNTLTPESIRNHFKREMDPWEPIAELIWNGFDADATNIRVLLRENKLGGTESVTIIDNGKGIDVNRPLDNFRRFNDSLKKKSHAMHGSKGRGRLAFHKICSRAKWYTRFNGIDARIEVESSTLNSIEGHIIEQAAQNALLYSAPSGTCVELIDFKKNVPNSETLAKQLSLEFGWHLALNKNKALYVDEIKVEPPQHTRHDTKFTREDFEFQVSLLHWSEKLKSEKSYIYCLSSNDSTTHHMTSSLNHKSGYYTSIFIKSSFFDQLAPNGALSLQFADIVGSRAWKLALRELNNFLQEQYQIFLAALADQQIQGFEEEGDFPDYSEFGKDYSEWRRQHTKQIIKTIIITDPTLFKNSTKRQRKIIIRLLDKISVSSENDALLDILEGVLGLDASTMSLFAKQLSKAKLENIIKTIEVLQKRELAVNRISQIMRDHYLETLETPDLQGVIESNMWLFGNQYESIGAEEDTFTRIAENLRNKVVDGSVDVSELESAQHIEGANRQVDLFLVRKQKQFDSLSRPYFRCVIIEIKRPSVALNKKHIRQVDDYAEILAKHPEFSGLRTKYEIVLVGRKISEQDYEISSRLEALTDKNEPGLVSSGQIKVYVKTWQTIIEEFRISNDFLLDNLKTKRQVLESSKDELIAELQKPTA